MFNYQYFNYIDYSVASSFYIVISHYIINFSLPQYGILVDNIDDVNFVFNKIYLSPQGTKLINQAQGANHGC